jgi:hypothetical protein
MTYLETSKITARVVAEVAGTIATNGIHELPRELRAGTSTFIYVKNCLISTAYNALRAMPGFNYSYSEFFADVEDESALLRAEAIGEPREYASGI